LTLNPKETNRKILVLKERIHMFFKGDLDNFDFMYSENIAYELQNLDYGNNLENSAYPKLSPLGCI
jgi:hypothetical protein